MKLTRLCTQLLLGLTVLLVISSWAYQVQAMPVNPGVYVQSTVSPKEINMGVYPYNTDFSVEMTNVNAFTSSLDENFFLEVTYPNGTQQFILGNRLGAARAEFKGTLPGESGRYTFRYYMGGLIAGKVLSGGAYLQTGSSAATGITVSSVSYRAYNLAINPIPMLDMYDVTITGTLTFSNGELLHQQPFFEVQGARITQQSFSQDSFTVRLDRITSSGTDALRLYADGQEIASWSIAAGELAAYSFAPGILSTEMSQGVYVTAAYWDSYDGIRDIDENNILVELSGLPIIASSISGQISSTPDPYVNGAYSRVLISARNLSNSLLRFTTSGNLYVTISANDSAYQSSFSVPVEYYYPSDGSLVGAPAIQSYAGDNQLRASFMTSSNRQVTEYWGTVTLPTGEQYQIQHSANVINNLLPIPFVANGSGELHLDLTYTDRNGDIWNTSQRYPFNVPAVQLSQNSFALGERGTLYLTLRDSQGYAVNGARINVSGYGAMRPVGGSSGEYSLDTTWNNPGSFSIEAVGHDVKVYARLADMLEVHPPEVLQVEAVDDGYLGGTDQQLRFKAYDDTGREFRGSGIRFNFWADGRATNQNASWDGNYYQVRITAWQRVEVQVVATDNRRISPKIVIEALKPNIAVKHNGFASGFRQELEITITHPVSGNPLSGTIAFRGNNLDFTERNGTSNGRDAKTGSFFSVEIYPKIRSAGSTASFAIDFRSDGRSYNDLFNMEVKEATTSFSPATLVGGIDQEVTVRLVAPDGKPIAGATIRSQTNNERQTNAVGETTFTITPSGNAYTFTVVRQDSLLNSGGQPSTFSISVPVERDQVPPTVTVVGLTGSGITTGENPYSLYLEFADDHELDSFFIGNINHPLSGKKDSWSGLVPLAMGENEIVLTVIDAAGNRTVESFIITFVPTLSQEAVVMVIGSYQVSRGGSLIEEPPVPPQIIAGRTMLPFRYLCQTVLLGTVDYIPELEQIVTEVNGHLIIMHLNNPIIVVDGMAVTLDQAPVLVGNHTMVPVRAFNSIVTDIGWDNVTQTVTIQP